MFADKPMTKQFLLGCLKYTGLAKLMEETSRWIGGPFGTIILFHRVTDQVPEDALTIHPDRFEKLCDLLRSQFEVVPLAEMFRLIQDRQPVPRRTVAITFDDCYRDNLFAARILSCHALPACFFIPTGFVGTNKSFPWDAGLPQMPNLTWEDIQEMCSLGHEIGSHTVTHPDMGKVSAQQARQELFESKKVLEHRLPVPVRWFAYPFGRPQNCPARWWPLLEEAGYEGTLSAHGGFVVKGTKEQLLPRIAVYPNLLELELHMRGALSWYHRLRRHSTPTYADLIDATRPRPDKAVPPSVFVGEGSAS